MTLHMNRLRTQLRGVLGLMGQSEVERLALLASQVRREHAIVEIGSWTGCSATWLAMGARAGRRAHVTAVDLYPEPRPGSRDDEEGIGTAGAIARFRANIDRFGLWSDVTLLRGASVDVAPMWMQPIGLLFDDATHTFEALRDDYEAWSRHIAPGGWLALHDHNETDYPGVPQGVREFILPTGEWEDVSLTESLWTARKR